MSDTNDPGYWEALSRTAPQYGDEITVTQTIKRGTVPVQLSTAEIDTRPPPTVLLESDDGIPIVYGGMTNSIWGSGGTGKSFIGMWAARQVIANGGRVLWLDFDASDYELKEKFYATLGKLAADTETNDGGKLRLVRGERLTDKAWYAQQAQWVGHDGLVVIDSAEKSGCPTDGSQERVDEWWQHHVNPFEYVCGVLIVDHISKNAPEGGRPKGPIGSQSKFARIRGGGWLASAKDGEQWTRNKGGMLTLTCQKDNTGHVGIGATVHVQAVHRSGRLAMNLSATDLDDVRLFIRGWCADDADASYKTNDLVGRMPTMGVKGSDAKRRAIVREAVEEGFAASIKNGKATFYTLTLDGKRAGGAASQPLPADEEF